MRTQGERALLLTFIGGPPPTGAMDPCERSYRPDVARPLLLEFFCPAMGYFRTASVKLGLPLGDRVLVDGTTGRQRLPFDGATLLSPRFLPDGWAMLRRDQASRSPSRRRGGAGGSVRPRCRPATAGARRR